MDKDDKNYINKRKVKDHCQYTGKFRGAAHSKCNLNYNVQREIPIIIHNASELNCIGDNMEKYITFSVPIKKEFINDGNKKTITCKLKLIDSYRFMQASLSELADNMSGIFNTMEYKSFIEKNKINSELKNKCKRELIEKIPGIYQLCNDNLNKFVLLLQKGVYPYEYMDSWKKLMKLNYHLKKIFIVI